MDRFGIQLYSVREEIEKSGFDAVLGLVKSCGYDCVEFAGFYGHTPEEVVELCKKHGLEPFSAHIGVNDIEGNLPYIDALGIKRVYIPWLSYEQLTGDEFLKTVAAIKKAKALLDERGVMLGYHNHDHEYRDGKDYFYELLNAVDGLTAEVDIFWVTVAGLKPTDIFKKYGDRLSAVHVKELDKDWKNDGRTDRPCAIVGDGQSGCREAIELAKKMNVNVFILEVEGFPCSVEECLKKSCDRMKEYANV